MVAIPSDLDIIMEEPVWSSCRVACYTWGSVNNPVWKILWKLKIPSKVKIFIWRTLHGIVHLKSILANRHIGTSGSCPICNQGAEDVLHLLFRCLVACEMWGQLGMLDLIEEATHMDRSGFVVLEDLFRRQNILLSGFEYVKWNETIAVTCWYMWWMRRRWTHDEDVPPMYRCKMSILSIASNAAITKKQCTAAGAMWS